MSETSAFVICTIILITLGIFMPYVIQAATGEEVTNDVSGLTGVEDDGISFTDFVISVVKAFFWYYGELNILANAVKLVINFIWAYLLVRLARGGG